MKLLTSKQIREADTYTIKHEPITSVNLMERAAGELFKWISDKYSKKEHFILFIGPGNNGGDGWALARMLWNANYRNIDLYVLNISDTLSPDSEINRTRLLEETEIKPVYLDKSNDFPQLNNGDIIIDALFGSGLTRPLNGLPAQLVKHINQAGATVIAIDIPSGLFSEDNGENIQEHIIKAKHTLSFQFPKLAFLFSENECFVGEWHVLPIGLHNDFISQAESPYQYVLENEASALLRPRKKFSHKGTYGHALLIAGSYDMMGAAVLSARAAIRSGVGLLSTHVPRVGANIIQTTVPESLLCIDESDLIFTEHPKLEKYSAVGIGPGLNQKTNTKKGLIALLKSVSVPVVLDADALNILASCNNWPNLLPDNSILTPHPKEFERLFGKSINSYSRLISQIEFSKTHKCVIVLKGAYTCITTAKGMAYFNTSGNAGMAKGGSGDVLTGIITGLLAQHYTPSHAAILGVYIHGLAGDFAATEFGQYGSTPSDIINNIGKAFHVLENKE